MNKFWIPALVVAAAFSTSAFADHDWDDGDRREQCRHRRHQRVEHVVVQEVYAPPPAVVYSAPPQVVYRTSPQVIYRDRVVYRDVPAYYQDEPQYQAPPPRYYEQRPAPGYNDNRGMGQAIGAVAGGVIGNQFGKGNGKVVSTAAGAVIGSMVGGNVATYGY